MLTVGSATSLFSGVIISMTYQVLARKWRPRTFSDLKGQDHVVRSFKGIFQNKNIGQAYLFTGTRGVGKTSLARIVSKSLNCTNKVDGFEPCLKCSSCEEIEKTSGLNYQEVDGASNNGVEDIRNLIDSLQYLPTIGEYRVFVIDEVHMLSISAFNALLKSLEEPPAHVIFIFATTDPQKIPETVISRLLRFDLRPLSLTALKSCIEEIIEKENLAIENEGVLNSICEAGRGSVRDTLTILEQLRNFSTNNSITEDDLQYCLGMTDSNTMVSIARAIYTKNIEDLTTFTLKCLKQNVDLEIFTHQLLDLFFRKIQSEKNPNNHSKLITLYQQLSDDLQWALKSLYPEKSLLIVLQKSCHVSTEVSTNKVSETSVEKNINQPSINKLETSNSLNIEKKNPINNNISTPKPIAKNLKRDTRSFQMRDFIKYLSDMRPASAANLELGSLIKTYNQEEKFVIEYGFPEKSRLMYDYFQEKDVYEQLILILGEYFQRPVDSLKFDFKIMTAEDIQDGNFKTYVEEDMKKEAKTLEQRKEDFQNQAMIKKAQEVFGKPLNNVKVK